MRRVDRGEWDLNGNRRGRYLNWKVLDFSVSSTPVSKLIHSLLYSDEVEMLKYLYAEKKI